MCGIAGTIGVADASIIAAMNDAQSHRGPDDAGIWVLESDSVALGHTRLSILDLSTAGHQPMANAANNIWITFNGEIYNYRSLRCELAERGYVFRSQTDTEVLLAAYEVWGEDFLHRLNGMYAFAIYDGRNHRLFAARDRIGLKPLYYHQHNGILTFASEIKALFACPWVNKRPDFAALATPARFQVSPYTGFEKIYKLPPGHSLTYAHGELTICRYWDVAPSESDRLSDSQAIDTLDALLNDAVHLQMVADVPIGILLSGGLDSSLVGALMRRNTTRDIFAFTIGFSKRDQRFEQMPDDSVYARRVANDLGFRYMELQIEPKVDELLSKLVFHLDEPLSDPATINTYLISQEARARNIVVLLNGVGGDEVFGGYRKQLACLKAEVYQNIVPHMVQAMIQAAFRRIPVANASRGFRTVRWAKRFATFAYLDEFERYLASDLSLSREQYERLFGVDYRQSRFYRAQQETFRSAKASYLTKMCVNDTKFFLPEHNLLYSDKAAMAAGVEGRSPLTDHRIVEFMFSLPPRQRIRGNEQKYLLKKVAERYLSRDIVYRPKAPFGSPLRSWVRGALVPMIDELLLSDKARVRELYDMQMVRQTITRDRLGLEDNALVVWTMLTTELWLRTNFA